MVLLVDTASKSASRNWYAPGNTVFERAIGTLRQERTFVASIGILFVFAGLLYPHAWIARWFGFAIAAYSTVANDSVQTLGTFLGSNRQRRWWQLWLFIGGVFLATVTYSWLNYDGDVTFGRLAHKALSTTPSSFSFLQVAAPIVLLVLTRFGVPVSTTLLLLSCFATSPTGVRDVLLKSFAGYGVALISALIIWAIVGHLVSRRDAPRTSDEPGQLDTSPSQRFWRVAQWCTTALLFSVWLMQDASNIAVFLPRNLNFVEFMIFAGTILVGLAWLFRSGGERVQRVVEEKSRVTDPRAATLVDLVYAVVLYVFKIKSNVPMSTTWVFIGLLAGREIAMRAFDVNAKEVLSARLRKAFRLSLRDLAIVSIGLVVSLFVALLANSSLS